MWEAAKSLGSDLDQLAEDLYNEFAAFITEAKPIDPEKLQLLLNIIAEIHIFLSFLNDEKVDKATINQLRMTLKNHRHTTDGQVLLPME